MRASPAGIGAIASLCVLVGAGPSHARQAAARPDFSGTWVRAETSGSLVPCSKSFKAAQDADRLILDYDVPQANQQDKGRQLETRSRRIVNFDGTDTRETFPPPPGPSDVPPGVSKATAISGFVRAAWNGDELVVVRHRTMRLIWPERVPPDYDWHWTYRDAYSLDSNGRLVVEGLAIIDPIPGGGLPKRLDLPTSWKCTYNRIP